MKTHGGFTERTFSEQVNQDDHNSDRNCLICGKISFSGFFLPYAHQVLCSNCSDSYGMKGKTGRP